MECKKSPVAVVPAEEVSSEEVQVRSSSFPLCWDSRSRSASEVLCSDGYNLPGFGPVFLAVDQIQSIKPSVDGVNSPILLGPASLKCSRCKRILAGKFKVFSPWC